MSTKRSRSRSPTRGQTSRMTSGRFTAGKTQYTSNLPAEIRESIDDMVGGESRCPTMTHDGKGCNRALVFRGLGGNPQACTNYCSAFIANEMDMVMRLPLHFSAQKLGQVLFGFVLDETRIIIHITTYTVNNCDFQMIGRCIYDNITQEGTSQGILSHLLHDDDHLTSVLQTITPIIEGGEGVILNIQVVLGTRVSDLSPLLALSALDIPEVMPGIVVVPPIHRIVETQLELLNRRGSYGESISSVNPQIPSNAKVAFTGGHTTTFLMYNFTYRFQCAGDPSYIGPMT